MGTTSLTALLVKVCTYMAVAVCPQAPDIMEVSEKDLTLLLGRDKIYALYYYNIIYINKDIHNNNKDITILHELVHHVQFHLAGGIPTDYCGLMAAELEAYQIQSFYEGEVGRKIEDSDRLRVIVDNAHCQMGTLAW